MIHIGKTITRLTTIIFLVNYWQQSQEEKWRCVVIVPSALFPIWRVLYLELNCGRLNGDSMLLDMNSLVFIVESYKCKTIRVTRLVTQSSIRRFSCRFRAPIVSSIASCSAAANRDARTDYGSRFTRRIVLKIESVVVVVF